MQSKNLYEHASRNLYTTKQPHSGRIAGFFQSIDRPIIITLLLIIGIGLVLLSSATSVISYEQSGDTYALVKQQILHGVMPGLLLFVCFSLFPYKHLQKFGFPAYCATITLISLSFIPGIGVTINNSHSWASIFGITVQPSEFAKITFMVWAAWWLTRAQKDIGTLKTTMAFSLYTLLVCGLLALQYDLGTMIIYGLIAGSLLVAAHAKIRHITLIALLAALGIGVLILATPYRLARVTSFWNPTADIQGTSYQLYQGLVAVGSGHWFGAGLGASRQKFNYVPEIASDSIFAIIAEELGFVFTVGLIILFTYLLHRGYHLIRQLSTAFGQFLALGILLNIAYQLIINISSIVGLVPLTGIPLPLISLGGSNMTMLLASLGIFINMTREGASHKHV